MTSETIIDNFEPTRLFQGELERLLEMSGCRQERASFNQLLSTAIQKLKGQYPVDALSYLKHASKSLQEVKHIFGKQKELEKYLLKLNKRIIGNLHKEKDQE